MDDQILMIEDYAYPSTDYRGDLDLPLPPGAQWGGMGRKQNAKMAICVFVFLMFYFYFLCIVTRPTYIHANVGFA